MARIYGNQPDDDPFGRGGDGPPIGGTMQEDTPIGVPPGYRAPTPPDWHRSMSAIEAGADPGGLPSRMVAPRYFDGDQYSLRRLPPSEIWKLQQLLAEIGLLGGSFQREIWDQSTAEAYAGVLAYANQQGLTEQQALLRLGQGAQGDGNTTGTRYRVGENGELIPITEGAASDVPPLTIRKTDPKVLRQIFQRGSIELLGTGLNPNEVQDMVGAYGQMEEQRQRDLYESQIRESGTAQPGEVLDIPSPEAFLDTYTADNFGPQREEAQGVDYTMDAMQLLASPAWGVGNG